MGKYIGFDIDSNKTVSVHRIFKRNFQFSSHTVFVTRRLAGAQPKHCAMEAHKKGRAKKPGLCGKHYTCSARDWLLE